MEPLVAEIERAFAEVEQQLQDPAVFGDRRLQVELGRRHRRLQEAHALAVRWRAARAQIADAGEMLDGERDPETRAYLQAELEAARGEIEPLEEQIRLAMLERDPADDKNVIVEIRQGAGGDEAALFAGELVTMLTRYADRKGFRHAVLNASPSEAGGVKDVTVEIVGDGAYSTFKWESGVHRVQRVPATEQQGRIHTSTATVAVLPEAEDVEVHIDPKDLDIDTIRGSGPGGQSVNTTDSAVRVTHKPTGMMVTCQDERSQLQNKDRAMRILRARLFDLERERRAQELSDARKSQIGSGARSEKIRTYNYPQSRVTDHRIKFTSHNLSGILLGELDELTDALTAEDNRRRLELTTAGTAA
jgi:peptide chain release factor 1